MFDFNVSKSSPTQNTFYPSAIGEMSSKTCKEFKKAKQNLIHYFENHYDTFDGKIDASFGPYNVSLSDIGRGNYALNIERSHRNLQRIDTFELTSTAFDRTRRVDWGGVTGELYHSQVPMPVATLEESHLTDSLLRKAFKALKKIR